MGKWSDIENSAEYRALNPEQKQARKAQFFHDVVRPSKKYEGLGPEGRRAAEIQFLGKPLPEQKTLRGHAGNWLSNIRDAAQGTLELSKAVGGHIVSEVTNPLSLTPLEKGLYGAVGHAVQHPGEVAQNALNYVGRYNPFNGNLGETLYNEPLFVLGDLSMLASMGGAGVAKVAGGVANAAKAAQAGNIAQTGPTINLINKASRTEKVAEVANRVAQAGDAMNPLAAPARLVPQGVKNAIKKVGDTLADARDRKTMVVRDQLGDKITEVRDALADTSKHKIVPSTKPNAAEAAAHVESTGLSRMVDDLKDIDPKVADLYRKNKTTTNEALTNHIGQFAGTEAERKFRELMREVESGPLYRSAKADHAPGVTYTHSGPVYDPRLAALMNRPVISKAFSMAEEVAKNEGRHVFEPTLTGSNRGMLRGEGVHLVKTRLDEMIELANKAELTPEARLAYEKAKLPPKTTLIKAKEDFLRWAEVHVPQYEEARKKFAKLSQPIDSMKVSQQLKDDLGTALEKKTAAERHDTFAKTVDEAPKLLKNTLGEFRYKRLEDALHAADPKVVDEVLQHLARSKKVEELAAEAAPGPKVRGKSDKKSAGNFVSKVGAFVNVINDLIRLGDGKISHQTAVEIAKALADPADALKLVESTIKKTEGRKTNRDSAKKILGSPSKIHPASYNALAPQQENQNALSR